MARDYYDESKPKKKKKETPKPQKVTQSPSVTNVDKKAKNSTFLGGGATVKKVEQRQTTSGSTTSKSQQTTQRRGMTDAQYQKTYGEPRRATAQRNQNIKPEPVRRTTNHRLTAAQTQKMYGTTNPKLQTAEESRREREERRKQREERRLAAQRQKSGLNDQPTAAQKAATDRAIKNTPGLMLKAGKDVVSGYGQTLTDVIARTASSERGTEAKAMKMGIEKGTKQYQELEEERKRTAEEARKDNQSLYQKMQERQSEWDEKTKDAKGFEKAYYGAVESGTGMIADAAIGGLTGTGQVGALASMGLRTYGSSANQARSEGATETEAAIYGLLQAGKEMGTEKIGGGGLAKAAYGKGALGLGDIATNTLIRNLKGQTADLAHIGVRLVGDVAEENIEEAAGWALDPWIKELTYGRNVRTREAQSAMKDRSDALRAEITNEDDARAAAAYLSSDDFIEQTKQQYIAAGLKEKDAEEVAERMRDYLTASLTGDTDSMEKIEDEVSKKVAGTHTAWSDYSFKELKETFEATSLLVAATGLPGNISTSARGSLVKEQLGDDGVRALANTAIDFEDSGMSTKARAMAARIEEGKELTGTQVYELQAGMQEQVRKDNEREQSSRRMAARAIENDNLLTPYRQNENGGIDLDEVTEAAYRESANKAGAVIDSLIKENKESITDTQKVDGSKAIAGFQTGVFTVDDANTLNYSNTTVRAAFEASTGVDLGQYVVKNKDGSVNIPATNTKTKDALFAMAADNLVKSAQAETANWMDNTKGQVVTQVSARMGANGSAVLQQALDDVDERDRSKYMMTANATDMLYQAARNMGTEWSAIAPEATRMFPGISESKLKMMYEAGLEDRAMANDKARGRQVRMGQALTEVGEQETATGKVFIDTEVPPKGSVIRAFTEIAKNLGADIHFVDYIYDADNNPIEGANGSYDPNTNTFYLNVTTGAETNIGYIFMHETTHYLKTYAPEQYQALENLVRERWFAFNPSQMQDAIARKIEAYKRVTKGQQVLTEEQALEEIIADASHDFINDPEFARQVAEEDMGLAKAILDSIRNALRMLRRIFASGSIDDDTHMNSLFRELDIMTEAEELWLNAYKAAVKNSAITAIDTWQNDVNEQSRMSVAEDKWNNDEKLTKAKFNSFYSAHKLTYGRATKENIDDVVEKIKTDGFVSTTAIANVVPASINDYVDPKKPNLTQSKYGAKEGDVVMFVPNKFVDLRSDIIKNGYKPRDYEIVEVERDYQPYYELYSKAYDNYQGNPVSEKERDALNADGIEELDDGTTARYSLTSWDETNKEKKLKALVAAGHSEEASKSWIDDINSIASIILADQDRLDYIADRANKFLKPNGDYYKYTLDASTLCDKRRIYQGTYDAIQHAMPNVPLMQDDVVRIRTLLKEMDHKAPCGICYVESQRKNLGDYAKQWYDTYERKDEIQLADVTTTNGLKALKNSNPEVAADFEKAMAAKGVSSPKVVKLRTDYREDIMRMRPQTVEYLNSIGGLRFHSFSDFETPHLIDTMQAVMDMSTKGLKGMAYAKVPNFAAVFGPTGIKINLSLIAKTDENGNAVHDENGRLVFDSVEGIPYEEAKVWRDTYPDDVAFILVGKDKQHTLEALNDDRVDFVIPFHRSKWSAEDMRRLGLVGYEDFATGHQENGIFVSEFWDYNISGKENAKNYLKLCAEKGVTPIFEQLLQQNEDGSYSLQEDGSTDNYWKLLVEGKMYNHKTGKGAPQKLVKPNFNMEEARRVLDEYEGGANELPVANDVVEAFVKEYKQNHPEAEIADVRYSIAAELDEPYMDAVNSGNMDEAQRLVDEAAKTAGYKELVYHGTGEYFNVFRLGREGIHLGNIEQAEQVARNRYHDRSRETRYKWGEIKDRISEMDTETRQSLINRLERTSAHAPIFDGDISDAESVKAYAEDALQKYYGTQTDINNKSVLMRTFDRNVGENVMRMYARLDNPFVINGDILDWTPWNIANTLLHKADGDTEYRDDFTDRRIDISGSDLNLGKWTRKAVEQIANGEVKGDEAWRLLDGVLEQAGGYHGIKYLNQFEGDKNSYSYIALNRSDVKLADPVTYQEDGSVIPLSERFDPNNNDIRYSLPTQDSDGNILTDGQMEYFKNSQARDALGRMQVVYHTTNYGGFTIFDPSYSDDKRSLFFASNWNVSQTYGRHANKPIEFLTDEEQMLVDEFPFIAGNELTGKANRQAGYYSCYLNLENPLIVDAKGHNWNDIPYGPEFDPNAWDDYIEDLQEKYDKAVSSVSVMQEDFDDDGNPSTIWIEIGLLEKDADGNWIEDVYTDQVSINLEDYMEDGVVNAADASYALWDVASDSLLKAGLPMEYINMLTAEEITFDGDIDYTAPDWDYIDAANNTYEKTSDWEEPDTSTYRTRELAEMAEAQGYDGVIIRDCVDIGGTSKLKIGASSMSDIFIAFSSNQVKDINNENPTENPDIRYSFTDDEEAMSHMAHDYAYDNSYEALAYYESLIDTDTPTEVTFEEAQRYIDKDIDEFYAGLTRYADGMKFDDPVLEEGRVRMARSKQDYFNSNIAKWNESWLTEGEVLDPKSVKKPVRDLVTAVMQESDTTRKYRTDLVNKAVIDMRLAYFYAKKGRTDVADALLWHSAHRMIDGVEFYADDSTYEEYKGLRDYLKKTRIQLGEEYWSDADYGAFRKANFGRINLVQGSTNVDQIYAELEEIFPGLFDSEEYTTPPDQLMHIAEVLDSIQPYKEAYSSEQAAEFATDIASDLLEIMQNGKELQSVADRYKNRYEAKAKAMKARHAEAMLKVRQQREKGIKAEKAKFKEYVEKQKEKKAHNKYFDSINRSYKKLTERLLTNTADKNIPEQYKKELAKVLAAFDLQTVGSKKYEARTGRQGKKSIKMANLKVTLGNIENKSGEFHVSDAVTDIIDELLGKNVGNGSNRSIEGLTIDELNSSELARIDKLLKALIHEFNTYKTVKINTKRQQVKDIGFAQVRSALEHAKTFGPGQDYYGVKGWVDRILNMDELTPAYLFRRIDPNKEGMALMYEQLEDSHDRYIRNTVQLSEWIDEIVGEYHHKGLLKKDAGVLEQWRSENYAQNFKLENGHTITLTPAQMMSVYCLSKRAQAYNHMTGAGIVVAPVSYNAKILSDLKKKAKVALPEMLTDSDIRNIVSKLDPDQVKVADKLQNLMADKMAAWGNEASMNVLGIELFGEPDYFPIKSDKAGLISDLSEDQFVEAIRSFGFTKAVQPGARNAIMVEDIFDVITQHCNNMNLYNAYSEAINDFMKVYNYRDVSEEGEYTVKQAIGHAYSQKATNFIMSFMKDLNGNVSNGRTTGINDAFNESLARAKKASVFANIRVAAQQPTAIGRAFAVISPKYASAMLKPDRAILDEMFEHCPIAKWKSLGYYDINMGRNIEDVIMNNNNVIEEAATWAYGALDNLTWGGIWQMVKAETEDKHPKVEKGSDEYWDLCNRRMREVVAFTQVVDSPFHRSHAMRSKNFMDKLATAFGAEPTLTYNMVRDGYIRAKEMVLTGDKKGATKVFGRTMSVFVFTAGLTAAAAAFADVLRGKNPDGDDDDEITLLQQWWANTLANWKDNVNLLNNIYYVKDIMSLLDGWQINNLAFQGWKYIGTGIQQLYGNPFARSKDPWWKNMMYGIGYLRGIPVKTVMTDFGAIFNKSKSIIGFETPILDAYLESLGDVAIEKDDTKSEGNMWTLIKEKTMDKAAEKMGYKPVEQNVEPAGEENASEPEREGFLARIGVGKTAEEKEQERAEQERTNKIADIQKKTESLSGEEKDKKVWSYVTTYLKSQNGDKPLNEFIQDGDYSTVDEYRKMYEEAGGNTEYFDQRIFDTSKSAMKKTIVYDPTEEQIKAQDKIKGYLLTHGMDESELSEMVYKSDTAKDMKVAFRLNDKDLMLETLEPLVRAGLTYDDLERLWENRNRMQISSYKGRYKDKLKSTGEFIWPTDGQITSYFGYRNAPTAGASSNHPAIDIGAPMGADVVAADGGVVIYAGTNGGYGNSVGIKHDNGMVTYYNHLSAWNVNVGDTVAQGQQIANVGSTGISTGPHLDFKILDADGEPVDPLKYLASRS